MVTLFPPAQVLLGEIDEDKETSVPLTEVSLEAILEAQSARQAEREERDRFRAKVLKERGVTVAAETAYDDNY